MKVQTCPNCGGEPVSYCHTCGAYTDELVGATADPTPTRLAVPDGRTEAEIQLGIRRALEALGYSVCDMSQGRKTRQTPGIPDLYVQGGIWLEVKRPGGKVSDEQVKWIHNELCAGGYARVVYSEAEAVAYVEGLRRER